MKVTQTIELTELERTIIEKFLKIIDEMSTIAGISMSDVFEYFVNNADIQDDNTYLIRKVHQIKDM